MNWWKDALTLRGNSLARLVSDESAQDLIEYALLAAAVAVIVAAFLPLQFVPMITAVFSKIVVVLNGS